MDQHSPPEILDLAFRKASAYLLEPIIKAPAIYSRVEFVCRNLRNRSAVRVLLFESSFVVALVSLKGKIESPPDHS